MARKKTVVHAGADARERLLLAAREVFVAKGFERATVRQIAAVAGVNVAAVSYHFGGKQGLYVSLLEVLAGQCMAQMEAVQAETVTDGMDAAQRLRRWVAVVVELLLGDVGQDPQREAFMSLLAAELAQPTAALDRLVALAIGPKHVAERALVAALLPSGAPDDEIRRAALGMVAQVVFYRHAAAVIGRLYPGLQHDAAERAALAGHVSEAVLAGLAAQRARLLAMQAGGVGMEGVV